jgi:hypothetical protein
MSELNQDANETPPQQQPPTLEEEDPPRKCQRRATQQRSVRGFDNCLELFDLTVLLEWTKKDGQRDWAAYFSP